MINRINKQTGFGLIEVLIAAAILAIGLIGLASLQSRAIKSVQEGANLVTAAAIAEEMALRMLSNPYITAQGRQGYLATDLSGDVVSAGGGAAWANATLAGNPNIARCYSANNTQSCYSSTATIGNTSDHIAALQNMQLMDQVEMRLLAANSLPSGEIMICFDSAAPYTAWSCNNSAVRVASRNENIFTVKVQWKNIIDNSTQMYAMQFTAQCTNNSATHCGN